MAKTTVEVTETNECPSQSKEEKAAIESTAGTLTALSNVLILRNIFKNLSVRDLKVYCNVNKLWRNESDLLLHQFNIQFVYSDMSNKETIFVQEIVGLRRETRKYEVDFEGLAPTINKVLRKTSTSLLRISLHLKRIDVVNSKLVNFVKTFGRFVFRLNYEVFQLVSFHDFSDFLWKYLPNLEEMHMDEFWLEKYDEDLSVENLLSENKRLEKLKTISFFLQEPPFEIRMQLLNESFTAILDLAPNLESIECFPLERVGVLTLTGKGHLVKGIQYPHHRAVSGHEVRLWLEELAKLKPQLKFFDPPRSPRMCPTRMFQPSKKYLHSILKSSRKTLEHLVIFPTQRFGYLKYPSDMTAVKILEFANESNYNEYSRKDTYLKKFGIQQKTRKPWRRFFPAWVSLQKLFPNVKELRVSLEDIKPENVHRYFPASSFQHMNVTKMYVNNEASLCLAELLKLFPLVTNLTVDITEMKIQGLEERADKISGFSHLRNLTLEIDSHKFFHNDETQRQTEENNVGIFDSVITGIPKDVSKILSTEPEFWNDDVKVYMTDCEPNLLAIKGLKTLKLVFHDKSPSSYYRWWWRCSCFPVLLFSEVSCVFGFRKYPHVNVNIRLDDEHSNIDTVMMIQAIGPALDYVNLYMDYQPPFYIKTNFPT